MYIQPRRVVRPRMHRILRQLAHHGGIALVPPLVHQSLLSHQRPLPLQSIQCHQVQPVPHHCGTLFQRCVIAISSEPSSQRFTVLAADPISRMFYWIRAGESRWSSRGYVEANRGRLLQLVAIGGKFYGLTGYGSLAEFDLDGDHHHHPVLLWRDDIGVVPGFDRCRDDAYLVECDGELLTVIVRCPRVHGYTEPSLRILRLENLCEWVDAREMVRDKEVYLAQRGWSMCRRGAAAAAGGGKVYTAGRDSFGVFDVSTGKGSVLCGGDPGSWVWTMGAGGRPTLLREDPEGWRWAVWVMPELIYGSRRTSRWVAVGNQAAYCPILLVNLLALAGTLGYCVSVLVS